MTDLAQQFVQTLAGDALAHAVLQNEVTVAKDHAAIDDQQTGRFDRHFHGYGICCQRPDLAQSPSHGRGYLQLIKMVVSGRESAADAARLINVHRATICRILEAAQDTSTDGE